MTRRRRPSPSPQLRLNEQIRRLVEAEIKRQMKVPPGAVARPINQDALMMQMQGAQAPSKDGTPLFSPGAPLQPNPALSPGGQPRQFIYPVGYNIQAQPRSTEATGFDTLRNLAALYDGIQLCEQVWLDTVAKLNLVIKPRDEIIAEQGKAVSSTKYADRIRRYADFFAMPDVGNGYDLKSWLRAAVRDQLQIDAVAIYVRRNRGGGVYSLELVDGATIKPLLDPRGRRPQPPYPAFQQFLYGVPAGLYTAEEMLYLRETTRTESVYGLSRVERIIMRINQALRKQNKDLSRFTEGNVPPGILEPPDDGSQWTPEQLLAYQEMWDALLAGNDQARARLRVIQPGSKITPLQDADIFVDFDRFLLNVTAACYSMTMADLGFTENVNKSSGDSQENVFYRRAVQPLMDRYAQLFTLILRQYFNEPDLVVAWSGFEESEDWNANATSYVALVNAGIVSPTVAAHELNLPWAGPDIPNFIVTKDGPTFLEDLVDSELRKAQRDAKLQGLKQVLQMEPPAPGQAGGQPQQSGQPESSEESSEEGELDEEGKPDTERADLPAAWSWRPPSARQTELEQEFAQALRAYLAQVNIEHGVVQIPDSSHLLEQLSQILEQAVKEGQRVAGAVVQDTGTEEARALAWPTAVVDLVGRAKAIVGAVVERVQETAQALVGKLFGAAVQGGPLTAEQIDEISRQATQQVRAWSQDYSELVAQTETHSAVEAAAAEIYRRSGEYNAIFWHAQPDACSRCKANEAASPIRFDVDFPSGDTVPPAHPRCRCTTSPARIEPETAPRRHLAGKHDQKTHGHGHAGRPDGTGSGLSAAALEHVSGAGPIDGSHEHSVHVDLGGETHSFTDKWLVGDIDMMLFSDHAYRLHGTEKDIDDADIELADHPDSVLLFSDDGKATLFTNEELSQEQISTLTDNLDVAVTHYVRESGEIGSYYEYADYRPSDARQT